MWALLGPQILPPEVYHWFITGLPLLFSFIAVYHGCTGKWALANYYLRQTSMTVLWSVAFYFGFIGFVVLMTLGVPLAWRDSFIPLIALSPLAGGWAGSLCWRGKLPGTGKETKPAASPIDAGDSD
ncbi:hypothetical protein [Luteolibacter soli]|uniref:Uncharacterized protein n=1 Tax=Luteolibacter soli TaxID=3135280 RepID=A0ABU9AZ71_9BACT